MFRRLHSNRDPRDTLTSELRKEFRVYVDKGNQMGKAIAAKYPKLIFGTMVILLTSSALSVLVLHRKTPPSKVVKTKPDKTVLSSELERVFAAGEALSQTIHLRRLVDSISAKKELSKTDSATLVGALDSLRHIQMALPH